MTLTRRRRKAEIPDSTEALVEGVFDVEPDSEVLPVQYSITSFGADFPVDGLVRRLQKGDIVVPTFDPDVETESGIVGFQRGYVWTKPQIDRFIESLLLGFPVPGIFLVQEPNNILLVLDGHQRLKSLQSFYEGTLRGKVFDLQYVTEAYKELNYKTLDDGDRRRLDNSIIHATIVRQDAPADDYGSVYSIFERLNTGGTPLQPQEIRVALYRGPFVNLLRELNSHSSWRQLYGPRSERLKDQELILRFFSFYFGWKDYARPVKGFLNKFIERNRNLNKKRSNELKSLFATTCDVIWHAIGKEAFRPQRNINAAVFDSVMVGIATRLSESPIERPDRIKTAYNRLLANSDYEAATGSSTAGEESVQVRISQAIKAFARIQ